MEVMFVKRARRIGPVMREREGGDSWGSAARSACRGRRVVRLICAGWVPQDRVSAGTGPLV